MAKNKQLPEYLVVGEILRPHGLRGELRMRVHSDFPEQLPALEYVYLSDSSAADRLEKLAVNGLRFNKEFALLSLAGYADRNAAELLRGKLVMIDLAQTAPLADGEYFLFQLIGLLVRAAGQDIGRVKEVLQTGANDVYLVQSAQYGEVLLPAHAGTVDKIDFEAGVIFMSLPDGLLPSA